MSDDEKELVKKAFDYVSVSLSEKIRYNGEPFIAHATAVAEILITEMGLTSPSVAALYLHEAGALKGKDIEKHFSKDILQVVKGLDIISGIDIKITGLQVENFRKLIVSLSPDPRVILIKLADRLEVMRSLGSFPKSKQIKKSNETLLLYAPLAHQLGLYNIKQEMEDTALRYIEPEDYRTISAKLKTSDAERNRFIADFIKPIEIGLSGAGLKYVIKSRTKSIYSIWRKMRKQNVTFDGVYDVFAIRIILDSTPEDEKADCWKAYSVVTDIYTPNLKRLRDWISQPRPTGYESLHTTVDNAEKHTVEVQIRTERMDEIAESGIAAHWRYKGVKQIESVQSWLEKVKELLNSPTEEIDKGTSLQELKHNEIFVFTPEGDLRQLPAGATVLDFAFSIHTGLGSRCVGAQINGKNKTIKEKLNTGDTVAILTSKNQAPKADWINYVITSKAKSRIKQSLREEETKLAQTGKEMLERRLKNWKLSLSDEILAALIKQYKLKVITDIYAGIASEKIDLADVKSLLTNKTEAEVKPIEIPKAKPKAGKNIDYLEIDEKLNNISFKLAKCCNPIMGDEIFGFVTIKEGIKIHRISCPNAARLLEHYNYRVLNARWKNLIDGQSFQASLKITGYEEPGIISRIDEVIMRDTGISMRSININNVKGKLDARLQVVLKDKKQLDMLIAHLQQVKGVEKVVRVNG